MISNETVFFEDTPLTARPGIVVGYRANGKAIYNIAGGSIDVSDDDVTDSDDNDDDDDSTDDSTKVEDEWTPPSREDWQKVLDAKKKADSEAAARKRFLRDNGFDPKTGAKIEKPSVKLDDDDDTDTSTDTKKDEPKDDDKSKVNREKLEQTFQRQLERETAKAETRGRSTAYGLISEVPSALEEAGWNGKNLPRMIKLLDLDSVEIDEDGVDADALTAQVSELKNDFPEFFKRSRMKDAAKEVADTGAVGGGKKKAPASEEELDWKARMKLQLTRPNN